jgi:tRNA/rRNA methyltransferase
MNLGQAVAVCLYEFVRGAAPPGMEKRDVAIEGSDAEQLTAMLLKVLEQSGYTNRITATSTEQKVRRWMRRMHLGRRDAPLMMGILRQVLWKFEEGGK